MKYKRAKSRHVKRLFILTIVLPILSLVSIAGTASATSGTTVLPGTYSFWLLPPSPVGDYNELTDTITPHNIPMVANSGQLSPEYFYAIEFYNYNPSSSGQETGYMGLQIKPSGEDAIFSWWGASSGTVANSSGISDQFTNEGTGWHDLIPYDWQANNTYKFSVFYTETTSNGSWFEATVEDTTTGVTTEIGTLEIPVSYESLGDYVVNFVEWFGPHTDSCSAYPWSDVVFSAPQAIARAGDSPVVASANGTSAAACGSVDNYQTSMEHFNGTS